MILYSTTDISASVHKAYEQFTHVVLNRKYSLHAPALFKSDKLLDLPLFQSASWLPSVSEKQEESWQSNGGVLINLDLVNYKVCDVSLAVECPYSVHLVEKQARGAMQYTVIPNPGSWATHDDFIDLKFPIPDLLREIWTVCAGKAMTNVELAEAVGMPVAQIGFLKNALKPKEHWYIQKRLAPEDPLLLPAWDWLVSGCLPRNEVTKAGFRHQVESMSYSGHIDMKRMFHFPSDEPDWRKKRKEREAALKDLSDVRQLVESLPDHLAS
jgi:hypothetical protein